MSPRLLFAYLMLSLLQPLLALVAAKPPDLPMNLQVDCQNPARPRPYFPHQPPRYQPPPPNYPLPSEVVSLETALEEAQEISEETCPCLDAGCLGFLEILGEIVQALGEDQAEQAETTESEDLDVMPKEVTLPEQPDELSLSSHDSQARHLYRIGERCRHRCDLDMARNCYEEVRRIAPKSSYGLLASGQLLRMKGRQLAAPPPAAIEAQEPPLATPPSQEEEQAMIEELHRMAEQLRRHSHAEPVCPFRRPESPARTSSPPQAPVDNDQPMSDAEMQEMLDDAQFLDIFLDDLVYPDFSIQDVEDGDFKDILVNVSEQPTGSLLFGAGINASAGITGSIKINRPEELTVPPAPRDLIIVDEPQQSDPPAVNTPPRGRRP
jgi:hypothetical protein